MKARDSRRYKLFSVLEQQLVQRAVANEIFVYGSPIDNLMPVESPEELICDVRNALSELAYEDQQLAIAYFMEGCTYRDLAERMNLSVRTVFLRTAFLKKRLRRRLYEYKPRRNNGYFR